VRSRHRCLLLAALCALLAAGLWLEIQARPAEPALSVSRPAAVSAAAGAANSQPAFVMPPMRAYSEVLARPLLSQTRRPPRAATAQAPAPSDLTLVGVIASARERYALIRHGQPPKLDRVAPGQELNGWMVEEILIDRVILGRADAQSALKLKDVPPGQGVVSSGGLAPPRLGSAPPLESPPPLPAAAPASRSPRL
jgi:hypothetical protein